MSARQIVCIFHWKTCVYLFVLKIAIPQFGIDNQQSARNLLCFQVLPPWSIANKQISFWFQNIWCFILLQPLDDIPTIIHITTLYVHIFVVALNYVQSFIHISFHNLDFISFAESESVFWLTWVLNPELSPTPHHPLGFKLSLQPLQRLASNMIFAVIWSKFG